MHVLPSLFTQHPIAALVCVRALALSCDVVNSGILQAQLARYQANAMSRRQKTHAAAACRPDLLAITAHVSLPATPHTELQPGTPGKPFAGGACAVGYSASATAENRVSELQQLLTE